MSEGPSKATMTRGALYGAASHAVALLIPIIAVPLSMTHLTMAGYGAWVQVSILFVWLSRTDLGLWAGVARETAERRARGDQEGLRALGATWLRWDLGCAAAVLAGAAACAGRLPVPRATVMALAVQTASMPFLRHLMHSISGFQRIDLVHRVCLVIGPLHLIAVVASLEAGLGTSGLALAGAVFGVLQVVLYARILRAVGYPLSVGPFRWAELRRLMAFGWKLEAWDLVAQLYRSDRLLIERMGASRETVGVYQAGSVIADKLAGSVTLLSTGILPAGADLAARGDAERLRLLFLRGTKYHAMAATLLLGFAAVFAEEILLLWTGRVLPQGALVLRIMAASGWVFAVSSCAQSLVVGTGRPGRPLAAALSGLAVAVLLYSAWGRRYHVTGLAASVAAGSAFGQVLVMIFLRGSVEFRWRELVGSAILKPLSAGAPLLGLWASHRFLPVPDGRGAAFLLLAPAFLAATALAVLLARATRALDGYDWDVLTSALRRRPA